LAANEEEDVHIEVYILFLVFLDTARNFMESFLKGSAD